MFRPHPPHVNAASWCAILVAVLLSGCSRAVAPAPADVAQELPIETPGVLLPTPDPAAPPLDEVAARQARIQQALRADPPILPLVVADDAPRAAEARQAQQIALATPLLIQASRAVTTTVSGAAAPLRTEVMQVDPLRASDLNEQLAPCAAHIEQCFRVRLYNYAESLTADAYVDLAQQTTLAVSTQDGARVTVPEDLAHLAEVIAAASPAIQEQLAQAGLVPTTRRAAAAAPAEPSVTAPIMSGTQTTLKNSSCAFSRHLCVAPTYVDPQGRRALWAVVDLTLFRLVGYQWTALGDLAEPPDGQVNEQSIREGAIAAAYCVDEEQPGRATSFDRDGWTGKYALTESDGLKIWDVQYKGRPVVTSVKLVDIHVAYRAEQQFAPRGPTAIAAAQATAQADPGQGLGPGYSDGVGCPSYSQSAVLAAGPPFERPLMEGGAAQGFEIWQNFRSPLWPGYCNYYYTQIFRFYADGRLHLVAGNAGRGCGDFGTYRPILRIAMPGPLTLSEWDGAAWQPWQQERWQLQTDTTAYTPEGYQYRLAAPDGTGWYLEPGQGQYPHNRGDNAYLYASRFRADEGEQDLGSIGSCCRSDEKQGPEQYLNGEPIGDAELVLWYVGQMQNSAKKGAEFCWADRIPTNEGLYEDHPFPCLIGPILHPFSPAAGAAP